LQGRMTGSGSAVFALLGPHVELAEAPPQWQVRECSNMEVHPLVGWASSDS
jgi:4-diphosphocytidyl-2-C-methyl-D-erythritol kinase